MSRLLLLSLEIRRINVKTILLFILVSVNKFLKDLNQEWTNFQQKYADVPFRARILRPTRDY